MDGKIIANSSRMEKPIIFDSVEEAAEYAKVEPGIIEKAIATGEEITIGNVPWCFDEA